MRTLVVLDRCKEPGALGEPLYLDVVTAMSEAVSDGRWHGHAAPRIIGGRYGLASKEFTPGMCSAVLDELGAPAPRPRFTIGITDDVGGTSLPWDGDLHI